MDEARPADHGPDRAGPEGGGDLPAHGAGSPTAQPARLAGQYFCLQSVGLSYYLCFAVKAFDELVNIES